MSRIRNTPRTQRDAGFTLIELVMAVTLSVMLIGAMVGALLTSISAASSNRDRVRDSVDLGLISAFLYKDAQAVGGSDPTVVNDATLGVSATDAAGCTSTGLVARFKWDDPTGSATTTFVVTYGLTGTNLSRFECKEGKLIDTQVLGRNVKSATLTCSPTCGRLPQTVSVRIIGSNTKSPLDQVLTASVRPSSTTATSSIGQTVDLMTLDSRCPALDLSSGTNSVTVGGQGVVSISGCKTPVDDPHQQLANYPVITSGVSDPLAGTVAIATPSEASNGDGHGGEGEGQYDNGGGNCYGIDHPTTIHRSGFPDITYYPSTVTISTHTHFAPGDYVYCRGLTVTSAGSIEGSGLFIQVSNGYGESDGHYAPLDIDHAASINATPQTTGTYAGILFWVASSRDVAIGLDGPVANYGGLIYAPKANVTFSSDPSSVSANIDAVIARQVTFSDAGTVHFGGAPSDISISPSTPPSAVAGQPYSTTFTAPGLVDARWSAPDLPTGMTIDNSGTVSGSAPSCDGSVSLGSIVAFDNADANAAAAGATFDGLYTTRFTSSSSVTYQPLTVRPFAAVTDPGTWVHGTVPLSASATNCLRSTTVAFQSRTSPSGSWSNISGCSATTAGQATLANFTCNWTPTSGTNYDLQVIATDHALSNTSAIVSGVSADNTAPVIGTITPATPFTFPGASTVVAASVTDTGGSGVGTVTFALNGTSTTCTDSIAAGSSYSCDLGTLPTNGTYTLTVTATDNAGNTASKTQSTYTVTNSGLTLGAITSPTKGSLTLTATPSSSHPYTLAWAYSKNAGTSWTSLSGCTTATCTVNTSTGLGGDGSYLFRVQMIESSGQGATTYTQTSTTVVVDNTAPVIGTITPSTPATFPGASTSVGATVTESGSGIASVTFTLGTASCTGTGSGPYTCSLDVSSLANGTYTLSVTATDNAGNSATKSQSTYTVTNSDVVLAAPSSTVSGTITLTATPVSSHPYSLTYSYSQNGGTTWTNITSCVAVSSKTCSLNTTTLTDNTSTMVRVQMVESSGQGAATYVDSQTTYVENLKGVDMAGINKVGGTAGKLEVGDSITYTYSAAMDSTKFLSSWASGTSGTVYVRLKDTSSAETLTVWTSTAATTAVQLGSVNLNTTSGNGYVSIGGSYLWAATMTLSSDGKTVTVKLGTQQSGATGTLATATSTAKFQWTPSAAALSARGTACSTAVVTVSNSGLDF